MLHFYHTHKVKGGAIRAAQILPKSEILESIVLSQNGRVRMILFFALMTFVPARYLYPTHRGRLNRWTNYLAGVWSIVLIWIVWRMPATRTLASPMDEFTRQLVLASLAFPAYYLIVSWAISIRIAVRAYRLTHSSAPRPSRARSEAE